MSFGVVSVRVSSTSSSATHVCELPDHATGDSIYVFSANAFGAQAYAAAPSGWKTAANLSSTFGGVIYYKDNVTAPESNPTFTKGGASRSFTTIAVTVRGAHNTESKDVATITQLGVAVRDSTPSVTTTGANRLILEFAAVMSQSQQMFFGPGVRQYDVINDYDHSMTVAEHLHTSTGATTSHEIGNTRAASGYVAGTVAIIHDGAEPLRGQMSPYNSPSDLITPVYASTLSGYDDATKSVDCTSLVDKIPDTTGTATTSYLITTTNMIASEKTQTAGQRGYIITSTGQWGNYYVSQIGAANQYDLSGNNLLLVNIAAKSTKIPYSTGNRFIGVGSGDSANVGTAARLFQVEASDTQQVTSQPSGTQQILLQPSKSSDYEYNIGSINLSIVDKLYIGLYTDDYTEYAGSHWHKLNKAVLITGSSGEPATYEDLYQAAKTGGLNSISSPAPGLYSTLQSIQVGDGSRDCYIDTSYQSISFPGAYNEAALNVARNINSGVLSHTVKVPASQTYIAGPGVCDMGDFHVWEIDASTSDSDIYNFDKRVVITATPVIRGSNIDYTGLSFIGCKELTHNSASLNGATVDSVASGETSALQFSAANQTQLTAIGTQCGTLSVTNNTNAPAIRINYTGTAGAVTIDLSDVTFSGNTTDLHFESTNNCDLSITRNSGTLNTTNSVGSTVTVVAPTNALRINPDVTISASPTGSMRYFRPAVSEQTPADSGSGDFLDYEYADTTPIDIDVVEQGYVPVNQQNVTPINGTLTIEMDIDEAYNASHGLTIVTHYTYNRATKALNILADQNAFDVRSSMADTIRTNSSYYNTPLLLEAKPGGKRIDLIDGATITSMATWKGAGMERYDALGTIYPIEKWYAIQSVQDITGASVIYRQTNSGDFTIGALTSGKFDETLQFYSDTTVPPDNSPETNNDSYLLIKALRVGYRQARNDVVAGNGGASLKADLYTIGLAPTAHDYAGGPIDLSASMALTYGPFTVGGKTISYKWTDSATNSGTAIADWINYMGATSPNGLIPGGTGLRWAEMPDMVIYVTGGVETAQGYREGATPTLVGFYMERGGADHPDMVRAQADDGTYYTPAQSATATISNFATTSRLQIYDTLNAVELYNGVPGATSYQFSETYSVDRDIRVRITNKVTTTASIMIEATVGSITASNPDVAYIANQSADTTYNNNAVDGDMVTGITINDTTDRVEIGIAGGSVPWKNIYAYQVAWLHTEAGIRDDFAFIDAPDTANYILTGFKIKNTSSPSVPLVITGGYGRDATTGASIDLIDTTGGSLFFAPDHVIPYATGSGVTSADKTEIIAGVTSSVSDTLPDAVWQSPKAIPKLLSVE